MSAKHSSSYINKVGEVNELDSRWFESANLYYKDKVVKRGRPLGSGLKSPITIRVDNDIVQAFRESGPGWQTRMNNALRDWLKSKNRLNVKTEHSWKS